MLSVYGNVLIGIFSFVGLCISLYQLCLSVKRKRLLSVEEKTVYEKPTVVSFDNFSVDDLALICRALSDSMNYHPDVRLDEKWSLLLRCKELQVCLEENQKQQ